MQVKHNSYENSSLFQYNNFDQQTTLNPNLATDRVIHAVHKADYTTKM